MTKPQFSKAMIAHIRTLFPDANVDDFVASNKLTPEYLGTAMATRYGFTVNPTRIKEYDINSFPGDGSTEIGGRDRERYFEKLRLVGCSSIWNNIDPKTDGHNHLNVYSQARTTIGKMCSNFYAANVPYTTVHGQFNTLEGYYHWLRLFDYCGANEQHMLDLVTASPEINDLRVLNGWEAIRRGRELKARVYGGTSYRPKEFSAAAEKCFKLALWCKLYALNIDGVSLGNLLSLYVNVFNIPLTHYYYRNDRVVYPPHHEWLPTILEEMVADIDPYSTTFDINIGFEKYVC